MQLYCRKIAGVVTVLATHADGDTTPASAYGEGVTILPYAGGASMDTLLGRPAPALDLLAYARARRYAIETGGITVAGLRVATDDRSKLLLAGARQAAQDDPQFTTPWIGADGTEHQLGGPEIVAISRRVSAHVNAVFKAFSTVSARLAADPPTITTTAEIDEVLGSVTRAG